MPNAKKWLFGDNFPAIASKEAELSRGLAKNLAPAPNKPRSLTTRFSNPSSSGNDQSKYQNPQLYRQRQKFFVPLGAPTDRRPTPDTPQAVARTDFRPRNFKHCVRLKNSIPLHALSKTSSDYTGSTRISLNSRQRDLKAFRKRSPLSSAIYSGRLLQSFISSPQKGGKHATGHRSQCLKSIHRKPPFPNGTSLKHKNSTKTRSFHDQTRSKGCISVSGSSSRLPKVSSLRLEKSDLSIQGHPLRSEHSTASVHRIAKACGSLSEEKRCSHSDLPRRYSYNRIQNRGNTTVHRNGHEPTRISEIHNQQGKVDPQTNSGVSLSGLHHQLSQCDSKFASRQSNRYPITVSPTADSIKCYSPNHSSKRVHSKRLVQRYGKPPSITTCYKYN